MDAYSTYLLPICDLVLLLGIYDQLRKMNGRMAAIEQWRTDHSEMDQIFHEDLKRRVARLEDRLPNGVPYFR